MSAEYPHMAQVRARAHDLVMAECRGPGDLDNAMRRVARRLKLSHGFLWRLRYRSPKDILVGPFLKLQQAWADLKAAQLRKLSDDISRNEALFGADSDPVRAARAVASAAQVVERPGHRRPDQGEA